MSKQFKLKNYSGYFFVKGKGFNAYDAKNASVLTEQEVACAAGLGYTGITVEVPTSFGVVYIRKGEGVRLLAGLGKNPANASLGQVDPSKRRFATRDEADQHGSRFRSRKANASDVEGSAGHEGYFVVETNDPVNSSVNWKTGLTNSIKA